MSDSNNDDFLFLGEEEEAPSSLSIELKKSDNIKKEKVENNAILINKNDKVNFNDFVNSDILSKLTKISFILLIFTSLCFTHGKLRWSFH